MNTDFKKQILVCRPECNLWGGDYKATDTINLTDGQNYAQCFLLSPMTHTNLAPADNACDLPPGVEKGKHSQAEAAGPRFGPRPSE